MHACDEEVLISKDTGFKGRNVNFESGSVPVENEADAENAADLEAKESHAEDDAGMTTIFSEDK